MVNKHVLNIISTHNGSPLSADDVEGVHSEIAEKLIGLVSTQDTQSPFRFIANITGAGTTVRTGADTYRQKASGKTVIFRVLQEAKINNFRLELSLNISMVMIKILGDYLIQLIYLILLTLCMI